MIASGLNAPTQSTAGIVAASASPALSYEIGQHFKGKNAEGTSAHILAHAILGAAVAAAGDNNALAGAVSAGGAEAAAPYISKWLYDEQDGSKLTAEQKETVTAITNLLGTATGAAVGNSATNAVQGSLNAQSATENNTIVLPKDPRQAVAVGLAGLGTAVIVGGMCAVDKNCPDAMDAFSYGFQRTFELLGISSQNNENNQTNTSTSQGIIKELAGGISSIPPNPDFEPDDKSKTHTRDSNSELNELLNNSTQRSNKNSLSQYDRNLNNQQNAWQQANKDFDSLKLRNIRHTQTQYGTGRVGTLPDGRTVSIRPSSSNGQSTIQIQSPNSNRVIKIRY